MGRAPKVDGKELHFGDPNGRGRPFDEIPSGTEENKLASARSRQEAQMSDVEVEGRRWRSCRAKENPQTLGSSELFSELLMTQTRGTTPRSSSRDVKNKATHFFF